MAASSGQRSWRRPFNILFYFYLYMCMCFFLYVFSFLYGFMILWFLVDWFNERMNLEGPCTEEVLCRPSTTPVGISRKINSPQLRWRQLKQIYLQSCLHRVATSSCRGYVDELATEPFLLLHREHGTGYRRSWNCCDRQTRFVVIWKHFCFILSVLCRHQDTDRLCDVPSVF